MNVQTRVILSVIPSLLAWLYDALLELSLLNMSLMKDMPEAPAAFALSNKISMTLLKKSIVCSSLVSGKNSLIYIPGMLLNIALTLIDSLFPFC